MTDLLFDKSRIGKFKISFEIIHEGIFPELIHALGITIIRAETLFYGAIEYTGVCPSFEQAQQGEAIPEYGIHVMRSESGDITYEVRKYEAYIGEDWQERIKRHLRETEW